MNSETRNRKISESHPKAGARRGHLALVASTLAALSLLLAGSSGAQEDIVTLSKEGMQRGTLAAKSIEGSGASPALEVESTPLSVTLPSGEPYRGYLITAYEPGSHLFWWTFQGASPVDPADRIANLPAHLEFFVSDREIVGIELGTAPPALWVLRSDTRVDSLEIGRKEAVVQVAKSAKSIEQGTARWMRVVSLVHELPSEFYYAPEGTMPKLDLEVASVERSGSDWLVTLKGREGRVAEVRLDDLFVLKGTRELEPEPGD